MTCRSIARLSLIVDDYDVAIACFTEKLGFDVKEDIPLGASKRWVVVRPVGPSGAELVLARADGPRQEKAVGDQCGGRVFLFLDTDDFARDHRRLMMAGVAFIESPRHEVYGTVAVFLDLWGNRWGLVEPARA